MERLKNDLPQLTQNIEICRSLADVFITRRDIWQYVTYVEKIININETKQPMKTLYSHHQNGFHLTCRGMLLVCLYQNLSDPEI